jgi:hypothetical protein
MCLRIDWRKHPDGAALIAAYDILVWKWLEGPGTECATSPHQQTRWYWGRAAYAELGWFGGNTVHEGLHAYIGRPSFLTEGEDGFPAIIPAGAQFWLGQECTWDQRERNIVANRMTVYRTLDDALQGRTLGKADFSKHTVAA